MNTLKVDAVFDIECEKWSRFVLAGWYEDGDFRSFRSPEKFIDFLLDLESGLDEPFEVWTFNGGRYDLNWLIGELKKREEYFTDRGLTIRPQMAGSAISTLRFGRLVFRDLARLMPFMTLAKAYTITGNKPLSKKTGLPCRCVREKLRKWKLAMRGEKFPDAPPRSCGGYCSIRKRMPRADFDKLARYLRKDCEAEYETAKALIKEADRCGYTLTATIAGSAWKTAQLQLELPDAEWDIHHYKRARAGYYGGRTQVFRAGEWLSGVRTYDIRSAYPAALNEIFLPVGKPRPVANESARRAYNRGTEGVFFAEVDVPKDSFVPPLPYRVAGGCERLAYPIGKFSGHWTALELRYAEEFCGVRVRIITGLVWRRSERFMRPFVRRVFRHRDECEGNPALESFHKTFNNSFTGKCAEKPDRERLVMFPDPDSVRPCTGECGRRGTRPGALCKSHKMIDRDGTLYGQKYYSIAKNGHVHWAAYLTSAVRVKWHKQAVSVKGGADLVAGDTDSIFSLEPRKKNIGKKLGQFDLERTWKELMFIAPKVYYGRLSWSAKKSEKPGQWIFKCKGIPKPTLKKMRDFAAGLPVEMDEGVMGLKSAARSRSGEFFQRNLSMRMSHADGVHFGDRVLSEDGRTYPVGVDRLQSDSWGKIQNAPGP